MESPISDGKHNTKPPAPDISPRQQLQQEQQQEHHQQEQQQEHHQQEQQQEHHQQEQQQGQHHQQDQQQQQQQHEQQQEHHHQQEQQKQPQQQENQHHHDQQQKQQGSSSAPQIPDTHPKTHTQTQHDPAITTLSEPPSAAAPLGGHRPKVCAPCVMCDRQCCPTFTLPCHRVCRLCLELLVSYRDRADVIQCVACYRLYPITAQWREHFFGRHKVSMRNSESHTGLVRRCHRCKMQGVPVPELPHAEFFCHQCQQPLCRPCHRDLHLHHSGAATTTTTKTTTTTSSGKERRRHHGHVVIPLVPADWSFLLQDHMAHCSRHEDRPLSVYCVTCEVSVCDECQERDHLPAAATTGGRGGGKATARAATRGGGETAAATGEAAATAAVGAGEGAGEAENRTSGCRVWDFQSSLNNARNTLLTRLHLLLEQRVLMSRLLEFMQGLLSDGPVKEEDDAAAAAADAEAIPEYEPTGAGILDYGGTKRQLCPWARGGTNHAISDGSDRRYKKRTTSYLRLESVDDLSRVGSRPVVEDPGPQREPQDRKKRAVRRLITTTPRPLGDWGQGGGGFSFNVAVRPDSPVTVTGVPAARCPFVSPPAVSASDTAPPSDRAEDSSSDTAPTAARLENVRSHSGVAQREIPKSCSESAESEMAESCSNTVPTESEQPHSGLAQREITQSGSEAAASEMAESCSANGRLESEQPHSGVAQRELTPSGSEMSQSEMIELLSDQVHSEQLQSHYVAAQAETSQSHGDAAQSEIVLIHAGATQQETAESHSAWYWSESASSSECLSSCRAATEEAEERQPDPVNTVLSHFPPMSTTPSVESTLPSDGKASGSVPPVPVTTLEPVFPADSAWDAALLCTESSAHLDTASSDDSSNSRQTSEGSSNSTLSDSQWIAATAASDSITSQSTSTKADVSSDTLPPVSLSSQALPSVSDGPFRLKQPHSDSSHTPLSDIESLTSALSDIESSGVESSKHKEEDTVGPGLATSDSAPLDSATESPQVASTDPVSSHSVSSEITSSAYHSADIVSSEITSSNPVTSLTTPSKSVNLQATSTNYESIQSTSSHSVPSDTASSSSASPRSAVSDAVSSSSKYVWFMSSDSALSDTTPSEDETATSTPLEAVRSEAISSCSSLPDCVTDADLSDDHNACYHHRPLSRCLQSTEKVPNSTDRDAAGLSSSRTPGFGAAVSLLEHCDHDLPGTSPHSNLPEDSAVTKTTGKTCAPTCEAGEKFHGHTALFSRASECSGPTMDVMISEEQCFSQDESSSSAHLDHQTDSGFCQLSQFTQFPPDCASGHKRDKKGSGIKETGDDDVFLEDDQPQAADEEGRSGEHDGGKMEDLVKEVFRDSLPQHMWTVRTLCDMLETRTTDLGYDLMCSSDSCLTSTFTWMNARPVISEHVHAVLKEMFPDDAPPPSPGSAQATDHSGHCQGRRFSQHDCGANRSIYAEDVLSDLNLSSADVEEAEDRREHYSRCYRYKRHRGDSVWTDAERDSADPQRNDHSK